MERDDTLACPSCRAPLRRTPTDLACGACGASYPVRDGLADLIPAGSSHLRDMQAHIHDDLTRIHNARKLPIYWQTGFGYLFNLLMVKHARMIARMGPLPGERYLDVGCQDGMILSQIVHRYGVRGTGVDISEESLRLALKRNETGNAYYMADALSLPFADGVFDCGHSVGTMEHVPDQQRYLAEMARVLRPGGRLMFDMINSRDALTVHGIERWWAGRRGRGDDARQETLRIGHDPADFRSEDEVREMCAAAGLDVRSVSHYNAIFPLLFDTRLPRLLAKLRGRTVDFQGRPLGAGAAGAGGAGPGPGPAGKTDGDPARGVGQGAGEPGSPGAGGLALRRAATIGLKTLLPVLETMDLPLTAMGYGNSFYVIAERS